MESKGRYFSFYARRTALSLLLFIAPLFYLRAQISFAPTNVYNGWNTTTQAFATVPTAPGLTFSQIARGSGLTSPTPVSSGITSTGWASQTSEATAAAANKFFFFSITANGATSFTVSSILFALQRSGTGPSDLQVQYSINSAPFAAFGNPFNNTSTSAFVQIVTPVSPISIPVGGNVVFRLVGWNSTNASGTFRVNNNTAISGTYTGAAPTLSTTSVSGAPFCISSTTGATSTVGYSGTGSFTGGNVFSAQLSDASGSFAAPVTIGTLASTALNGTINATLPAGTASGTGYRVRVVSSAPAVTGSNNGSDISIRQGVNFSYATTPVNCNGASDGAIISTVNEGIAPFTYVWSTGSTASSINGLSPGTYSLTVTGNNGCTSAGSTVAITEPTPLVANALSADVQCNGVNDGSVTLSVSGGTATYSYAWSNSATTQSLTAVGPGSYSVTVTDNHGCTQTASAIITEPTAISAAASAVDIGCNGGTDGSVTLSVNGGTAPYTYAWSNSATTQNLSGIAAGTYSVTITDDNNCTHTASVVITEPAGMSASTTVADVSCNGGTNGSVNLSVSGGALPYTFSWSNSATTQNISGVAAGTYSVIVTDNNGCERTTSVSITEPAVMSASVISTDIACNGQTNGAVSLTVNGGTAPYTYAWNNSATTQNISALAAGTYSVIVTDNNGCTQTSSVSVTEPVVISASATATNALCNNGTNGNANLSVSGGTGPYAYSWNNSATTQNISNLAAGTYSVVVTDDNGCTQTASVIVTEPGAILSTATATNVLCNGGTNGNVNLSVNGGTAPYTYAWNNSAITQDISNLAVGTYSVIITDDNGCTQTSSITVTQPNAIVPSTTVTDVLCNAGTNGDVNLSVNGGTAPYTYAWNNSAITQDISNLAAGTYSVIITDNNGCTQTSSVTVTQPNAIVATTTGTDVLCNGGTNGDANLSVNGGTAPYTYAWNNSATTQNISSLTAGTYSVVVTDNNGCTQTASVVVTQPGVIVAMSTTIDVACNNGTNGNVNLSVNGGTAPYTYAWSNSATTQNISNLGAGTYSVIITDNNGCTQTSSVTVTQPNVIAATTTASNVLCNGGTSGDANLSVNGGTSPYTYAWSNSATTQNISNLAAGTYSVIITDDNGCTQTSSVTVTQPNAIVATTTATDVLCNAGITGDANLSVNGGTAPYTYAWSNSATTQNISNLTAGTYSVIVTDDNGCTQTTNVTVSEPLPISSTLDSTDASCGTCPNGSADLTVNGGTAPYTYAWSNSSTSEDLINVLPGTYTVIITDNSGCQYTDSIVVNFSTSVVEAQVVSGVHLYPNPSNDGNITISLQGEHSGDAILFVLYDLTGQIVYQENFTGANMYLVVLPVANGTYLYRITQNGESLQSEPIIITK